MNAKKKKRGFRLIIFSLLLLPGFEVLFIIGCNSNYLIRLPFFILVIAIMLLLIIQLIIGVKMFIKNRGATKRRLRKWLRAFLSIFITIYIIGCIAFVILLYLNHNIFTIKK